MGPKKKQKVYSEEHVQQLRETLDALTLEQQRIAESTAPAVTPQFALPANVDGAFMEQMIKRLQREVRSAAKDGSLAAEDDIVQQRTLKDLSSPLPDDCWFEILQFLPVDDLFNVCTASNVLRILADANSLFVKLFVPFPAPSTGIVMSGASPLQNQAFDESTHMVYAAPIYSRRPPDSVFSSKTGEEEADHATEQEEWVRNLLKSAAPPEDPAVGLPTRRDSVNRSSMMKYRGRGGRGAWARGGRGSTVSNLLSYPSALLKGFMTEEDNAARHLAQMPIRTRFGCYLEKNPHVITFDDHAMLSVQQFPNENCTFFIEDISYVNTSAEQGVPYPPTALCKAVFTGSEPVTVTVQWMDVTVSKYHVNVLVPEKGASVVQLPIDGCPEGIKMDLDPWSNQYGYEVRFEIKKPTAAAVELFSFSPDLSGEVSFNFPMARERPHASRTKITISAEKSSTYNKVAPAQEQGLASLRAHQQTPQALRPSISFRHQNFYSPLVDFTLVPWSGYWSLRRSMVNVLWRLWCDRRVAAEKVLANLQHSLHTMSTYPGVEDAAAEKRRNEKNILFLKQLQDHCDEVIATLGQKEVHFCKWGFIDLHYGSASPAVQQWGRIQANYCSGNYNLALGLAQRFFKVDPGNKGKQLIFAKKTATALSSDATTAISEEDIGTVYALALVDLQFYGIPQDPAELLLALQEENTNQQGRSSKQKDACDLVAAISKH